MIASIADFMEKSCVHGHITPPECLACTIAERDDLWEDNVGLVKKVEELNHSLALSTKESHDLYVKVHEQHREIERLEQLCLDLVTGMDALSSLLIEHHACSDDGTGSLICHVCASKTGRRLWKESDVMKQAWCDFQKQKHGKPF